MPPDRPCVNTWGSSNSRGLPITESVEAKKMNGRIIDIATVEVMYGGKMVAAKNDARA